MKTAIITGASSGLGREFVRQIADVFPEVESYWLIARRADRLEEIADTLPGKTVAACRGKAKEILQDAIENYLGWNLYVHE